MSNDELGTVLEIPIPKLFHSVEFDGLFRRCIICNIELLDFDELYLVEKVYRGSEPIVEYAMCLDCCEEKHSEFSQESLTRIEKYISEQVDWNGRRALVIQALSKGVPDSADQWIEKCFVTGQPKSSCRSYQICGMMRGDRMLLGHLPYMIGEDALKDLKTHLSPATRDRMRDFIETKFGMPPEFCDEPNAPVFV